jgi:hypothetical protein
MSVVLIFIIPCFDVLKGMRDTINYSKGIGLFSEIIAAAPGLLRIPDIIESVERHQARVTSMTA